MQNLIPVPILFGLNDVPEILEDGPNGAMVTQIVNQLVNKSFRPFNTLDDNNQNYERRSVERRKKSNKIWYYR